MPNPAHVAFFRENKEDILKMIVAENRRREVRSLEALSDDEIDDAVGEMMSLVSQGQRLRAFHFPTKGETVRPPEPARPDRPERPAPQNQRPETKLNAFVFEVVVCGNGFLMNVKSEKGLLPWIFRTEAELLEIFRSTIFKKLEELKAKGETTNDTEGNRKGDAPRGDDKPNEAAGSSQGVDRGRKRRRRRRRRVLHGEDKGRDIPNNEEGREVHPEALGGGVPEEAGGQE